MDQLHIRPKESSGFNSDCTTSDCHLEVLKCTESFGESETFTTKDAQTVPKNLVIVRTE